MGRPHPRGDFDPAHSDYFLCARANNAIATTLPDQAGALTPGAPARGETTYGPGG